MTLGTHPNIVYIVNEATAGTLKRYDVVTGSKVEVVKLASTSISEAQVSANGQWLLFVAHVSGQNKLQLVRMDGQFLQTLYCGAPGEVQWSTNQQLVLFSDSGHIYLLNVTNGALQVEVSTGGATVSIHPRTWLDNTRAYLTLQLPDGPPETLVILDTSKGPNQNFQNLPVAFDATPSTPFCWDFDSSFDGRSLFTSQCTAKNFGGPLTAPIFDSIEEQTRKNMALFEQALAMFNPFGNPLQTASRKPAGKSTDEPSEELGGQNSNSDIEEMRRQLDQLRKRIETLAPKE